MLKLPLVPALVPVVTPPVSTVSTAQPWITRPSPADPYPRRDTKAEKRALELQQQQQQQQQLALVQQQQRFMYGSQAVSPVPIAGYDQYGRPVAAYAPPAGYYGAPDMRRMVPTYSVSPYDLL